MGAIYIPESGLRPATKVIAAYNSADKSMADYVCDGVDDQVEIQAAVDVIATSGRTGEVVCLDGIYNFSGSVVSRHNTNNPTNQWARPFPIFRGFSSHMWGSGTIFRLAANNVDMFVCENSDNTPTYAFYGGNSFGFRGIRFAANGYNGRAFKFVRCHNVSVYDCDFELFNQAWLLDWVWDARFCNNDFRDCGSANTASGSVVCIANGIRDNSNALRFIANRFEAYGGPAIFSYYNPSNDDNWQNHTIQITLCKFENSNPLQKGPAIMGPFVKSQIIANTFYRMRNNDGHPHIDLTGTSYSNIIMQNHFLQNDTFSVRVNGGRNIINNNIFSDTGSRQYDIRIEGGDRNHVGGNNGSASVSIVSNNGTNTRIYNND